MATALSIYVNTDTQDLPLNSSGVTWDLISPSDSLIFSAGNPSVADGQPIPGTFELNKAGIVLDGTEKTVDKYFLADVSANLLKQINNMGNQDKRYVMAFDFDGATTSEPTLEVYDDINLNSITNVALGGGVPASSWYRGITTTGATPGLNWTGSRLAGSTDGNFLNLNDDLGALTAAKTLYCNIKLVIPATQVDAGASNPVFSIKFTTT